MLACFLFAFYTALSRVFDYWHHWSDVFSGALLGTAISLFVVSNYSPSITYITSINSVSLVFSSPTLVVLH